MRARFVVLPLALLACLVGCEPSWPGTSAGTFRVVGALVENTCGAGFPVLDTVEFTVEVRDDHPVGYWRLPRQPLVPGSYRNEDGAFEFRRVASVVAWPADVDVLGCTLEQREVIRGNVTILEEGDGAPADAGVGAPGDGGNPASDAGTVAAPLLLGEHVIEVVVAPNQDCAALLEAAGGTFDALLCRARYTFRGESMASF
jgi:hypothetical protein